LLIYIKYSTVAPILRIRAKVWHTLAGLVHITVSENNARRYAARLETLRGIHTALEEFLGKQD